MTAPAPGVLKLQPAQTRAFDVEYVDQRLFDVVLAAVDHVSVRAILDVGGGNGVFADKLLGHFHRATVTNLEPDSYLAGRNQEHARKRVIRDDFQSTTFPSASFDLIFFNWVLHHFVSVD